MMISTKAVTNSLLAPGIQNSPQLLFAAAQIQVFGHMKILRHQIAPENIISTVLGNITFSSR